MKVYIKHRDNDILTINCKLSTIVHTLKRKISKILKTPISQIILTYSFKDQEILLENLDTLEFYGIDNLSCLIVKTENQGGKLSTSVEDDDTDSTLLSPNIREFSMERHETGDLVFHFCQIGNIEGLLEHFPDIRELGYMFSTSGWIPLHYAAFYGHVELLELLINYKSPVNQLTMDG